MAVTKDQLYQLVYLFIFIKFWSNMKIKNLNPCQITSNRELRIRNSS